LGARLRQVVKEQALGVDALGLPGCSGGCAGFMPLKLTGKQKARNLSVSGPLL
jgi:hypothetical protein